MDGSASVHGESGAARQAVAAGLRTAVPLALPAIPIGLILGVAIRDSAVIDNLAGWSSSWLILAGAAQLASVDLIDQGAGVFTVLAAVFMINARHLMYSAALSHRFRHAPIWFRLVASYLLLDQTFAMNADGAYNSPESRPLDYQIVYYLATAIPMVSMWLVATAVGILIGDIIPAQWEVGFTIPIMFLGLMVMSISNRPGILASVVGGAVAVAGRSWPSGTGLLAGAVLGVIVGGAADWYQSRNEPASTAEPSTVTTAEDGAGE